MSNPSGDGMTFEWSNKAGKTWTLYSNHEAGKNRISDFDVGEDCPYQERDHSTISGLTNSNMIYDDANGGSLVGIVGAYGKVYYHVIDFSD